jgi:hypothetical protein
LKTRFTFCEFIIFTLVQAVNRRSFRFKPRPAHVGFVVRKGTLERIFFPLLRGFSVSIISGDRDSSVDIATRYVPDGPGIESRLGGEVFRTRPDRRWGPPSPLYNGYWVTFPVLQRPGRGVDHPPPSSAEGKEGVELYLYSLSGPSWPVLG